MFLLSSFKCIREREGIPDGKLRAQRRIYGVHGCLYEKVISAADAPVGATKSTPQPTTATTPATRMSLRGGMLISAAQVERTSLH
jgi:hypothetical protein